MHQQQRRVRRRDLAGLAGGTALLVAGGVLWAGGGGSVRADVGALPTPVPSATATTPAPAAAVTPRARATAAPPAAPAQPARPAPPPVPQRFVPPSAAFAPERLVVPGIDLDAPVVPVGAPEGVLEVPEDPAVLGWWRGGARPGSGVGSVVVDGHVDSARYGRGPLKRAVELRPGDRAVLTGEGQGGRRERTYVVRAVRTFEKERLPAEELFTRRGPERLVLVTCGGEYDRDRGGWDSNVVVVLEPAR